MSVGAGILGSIYSRLPQSTNDFDVSTDEEDLLSHARKFQHCKPSSLNTFDDNPSATSPPVKMGEYQPLGQERSSSASVHINGFNNINYEYGPKGPGQEDDLMMGGSRSGSISVKGNTPASKVEDILRHPMSTMRRVAFIMSILLCIFTIVAFLWVLPCEWASCPAVHRSDRASSWEKTLLGLEIIGTMTVVPSNTGDSSNLLLMVRGEINFPNSATTAHLDSTSPEPTNLPANGGGIMTLLGSTGEVAWFKPLNRMPRDIDCSLIDVNSDGSTDCLLVGAQTLLVAFNAKTGSPFWYVHNHDAGQLPVDMDFPLILPDMDGDTVPELAVACGLIDAPEAAGSSGPLSRKVPHNAISLISGKMGKVIGAPYIVTDCESVQGLNVDRNWLISFTCQDAVAKDSVKTILLKDLIKNVTQHGPFTEKFDFKSSPTDDSLSVRQHQSVLRSSGSTTSSTSSVTKTSTFVVNGRRLTMENCGVCPDQCTVSVRVTDERHGRTNETIWNDGGAAMYALTPAVLSFGDATGTVSIFVLKFWHWTETSTSAKDVSTRIRRSELSDWLTDDQLTSSRFARSAASSEEENQKSDKIDLEKNLTQRAAPTVDHSAHFLTERIVLLTFNATDLHPINASQSEIQQLCTEVGCQPSLEFQEHSLLITDLDHDDSQEVVSYLTTYAPDKEAEHTDRLSLTAPGRLRLVSKIRVVRLEAELPKLYKAFTRA